MTQDEFGRIVVALAHSASLNAGANWGILIRLSSAYEILHSNLHPEDKAKFKVVTENGIPRILTVEEKS
jgi:hypothetical protein